jgi:subtilisin family serine protease/uncharacterized membrane protein
MPRIRLAGAGVFAVVGVLLLSTATSTQVRRSGRLDIEIINNRESVVREVIVKLREPLQRARLAQIVSGFDPEDLEAVGRSGTFRVRSRSLNTTAMVAALSKLADVAYAEPNFVVRAFAEPNDPGIPHLWGLRNTGQTVNGVPGLAGADIGAIEAWDTSVGSATHVVGVIDTGIDYTHSDLAANIWSAPAPFTVTIGGVSITCQAGTHGFNAIQRTCDPMDDHNHGTHVSGTIGGKGNNGFGVAGVNWITSLMGLKFLDSGGSGTVADAIAAIEFAIQAKRTFAGSGSANIRVLSNSWGGGDFSQALLDQIEAANSNDMLFVAAAGNSGLPNDIFPTYPASYTAPNMVAVAATTNTDARAFFSNYGAQSVHLGAPGDNIISTIRGDTYSFASGTSMAAPHVSGAAALVLSVCTLDTDQLKQTLLDSVDLVTSLASKTTTGGRLNVNRALQSCTAPPATPANLSAVGGNAQVSLAWSPAAGATSYSVKRSVASGGPYTLIASSIKAAQYVDSGLVNDTPYYYVISARNMLGESGDSTEASAVPKIPADLVVSALIVPAEAGAGLTLAVSVTTKNQGAGTAGVSTTGFYLSLNSVVEPGDILLDGAQTVPSLAPGVSAITSISLGIPASLAAGQYYVIAKADAEGVVFESQEANNTRSQRRPFGPDMVVSTLTVPATATLGAAITASHTVKNEGGGAAPASNLKFYLSANSTLDTSDTLLAGQNVAALGPAASASGQTMLTIPSDLGMGTYYVIADADGLKAVSESDESNNTAARAVQIGADLSVSAFTVPAKGEGAISVTDTTTNQGSYAAAPTTTRFYLSSNSVLDAGDTLLQGSRLVSALAPAASESAATTVAIPPSTAPGSYYVIAKADADNAIAETQEGNNTLARSIQIGGDLVIPALTVPSRLGAGASFIVTDTTRNQGGGDTSGSLTQFYLSTDAIFSVTDTLLSGSRAISALAAGESSIGSTTVTIPAGTSTGSYYFFAKADAGNTVTETSETNNTFVKSVAIGPDLIVTAISVTLPARAGSPVSVTDTVMNQGGDAGDSIVRYYLSANITFDTGDLLLSGSRAVPALAAGAMSSGSASIVVPVGTTPGTYYVFAKADGEGSVAESSETNNTKAKGIQVTN